MTTIPLIFFLIFFQIFFKMNRGVFFFLFLAPVGGFNPSGRYPNLFPNPARHPEGLYLTPLFLPLFTETKISIETRNNIPLILNYQN